MHEWHLKLFGGLTATSGTTSQTRFRTQKAASLLAYLALHPGSHSREALIDLFWPEFDLERGQANLRVTLAALRRQLEPPGTSPGAIIRADRTTVQLTDAVKTDVSVFETAIKRRDDGAAVAQYEGELLRGFYDEWIFPLRRQQEAMYVAALERHLTALESWGEWTQAIDLARQGSQVSPDWDAGERRVRELEDAARRGGANDAGSPRKVEKAAEMAAAEIEAEPHPQVSLPTAVLEFFGREEELERLRQKWGEDSGPVVITGYGGVGKSRLSLECARRMAAAMQQDGTPGLVAYVPLAPISHVDGVAAVALEVIGVPRTVHDTPWELLVTTLKKSRGGANYLVFDNAEHLLPDLSVFFERLLREVPGLRLLVTSRIRTGISGEVEFPLEPLPLSAEAENAPEALMKIPSVALFAHRAALARPDFAVTSGNAGMVAQLCQRLDGLPLALELTAARAGALSPRQMLERLEDRFSFLTTSKRTALERHRSLHAALDWSVQLLPPELAKFWCQLSVFRGGFTAEAATGATGDEYSVHQLSQLRAASLVGGMEQAEELRCSLLETLREYGKAQLEPDELIHLRGRHATYFTGWAEQAVGGTGGPDAGLWVARFALERENLLTALDYLLEHDAPKANQLALAVGQLFVFRGQFIEASEVLERAIEANGVEEFRMAPTLVALGQAENMLTRLPQGRMHLEQAVKLSLDAGDDTILATAGSWLMLVLRNLDECARGWDIGQQALEAARRHSAKSGNYQLEVQTLMPFSAMWQLGPSYQEFDELMVRLHNLSEEKGYKWATSHALFGLSLGLWEKGLYQESEDNFRKSLAISTELGDYSGIGRAYWGLGYAAMRRGRTNEARGHFRMTLEFTVKAGVKWGIYQTGALLAEAAILEGRGREAASILLASWDKHVLKVPLMEGHIREAMRIVQAEIPADEFKQFEEEAEAMTLDEFCERAQAL